jgi:hypothetical protein
MVCGLPSCSVCGADMEQGYCVDAGLAYYCTEECLRKDYTAEQWEEMYDDGNGESYYTTWEPCAECLADGCGANCGAGRI